MPNIRVDSLFTRPTAGLLVYLLEDGAKTCIHLPAKSQLRELPDLPSDQRDRKDDMPLYRSLNNSKILD